MLILLSHLADDRWMLKGKRKKYLYQRYIDLCNDVFVLYLIFVCFFVLFVVLFSEAGQAGFHFTIKSMAIVS